MAGTIKIPSNLTQAQKGSLVPWDKANKMWRVGQTVTVMDPKTGMTFQAYRIGGYNHADYVPATKKDTAIVYALYRNHWTWERKSMLVQLDDKWIAASTNGMPHGQWSKLNNDMNGMLCMHFLYSKTHIHNAQCPMHQRCVLSAAQSVGKIQIDTEVLQNFGELKNWSEVDEKWSIGMTAEIMELTSGETIRVVRTGGIHNAVFEPEDADQERKLRELIGDEPVSVLARVGDQWIAASFGYTRIEEVPAEDPTLAGTLNQPGAADVTQLSALPTLEPVTDMNQENSFSLYFLNSKSEDSSSVNFVQQLLALEAAGSELMLQQKGELVDWAQADNLWREDTTTYMQDWQTGALFSVRRVGGKDHAELTFASKSDENSFLSQLGGSYGLSMRPVMIYAQDKWIAASMLCTPHAGEDSDEKTFCVHFMNSPSFATGRPDPAHQQSVLLASGEWMATDGDQNEIVDASLNDSEFVSGEGIID